MVRVLHRLSGFTAGPIEYLSTRGDSNLVALAFRHEPCEFSDCGWTMLVQSEAWGFFPRRPFRKSVTLLQDAASLDSAHAGGPSKNDPFVTRNITIRTIRCYGKYKCHRSMIQLIGHFGSFALKTRLPTEPGSAAAMSSMFGTGDLHLHLKQSSQHTFHRHPI